VRRESREREFLCAAPLQRGAFTLIELLVVISIIALLMAILLPTMRRVRNQGRAVVCQSNLKQWGTITAMYVSDHNGRLPGDDHKYLPQTRSWPFRWMFWYLAPYGEIKGIRCCPMATELADSTGTRDARESTGGTFLAWGRLWPKGEGPEPWDSQADDQCYESYSSYAFNDYVGMHWWLSWSDTADARCWRTADVRGSGNIPVQVDCAWDAVTSAWHFDTTPPECDAVPSLNARADAYATPMCIDRHDGGVNTLFLDWSVRKVGLKELWTLKWNREFQINGPWTKAGDAEPQDWPQWMQNFKDY